MFDADANSNGQRPRFANTLALPQPASNCHPLTATAADHAATGADPQQH